MAVINPWIALRFFQLWAVENASRQMAVAKEKKGKVVFFKSGAKCAWCIPISIVVGQRELFYVKKSIHQKHQIILSTRNFFKFLTFYNKSYY